MELQRNIRKGIFTIVFSFLVICIAFMCPFFLGNNSINSNALNATGLTNANKIGSGSELWNSSQKSFNTTVLDDLQNKLFGNQDPIAYIKTMKDAQTDSYVIPASTINAKVNNYGYVVKLGGLNWMVTSLTLADINGTTDNVIVTLYLADYLTTSQYYSKRLNSKGYNMYSASVLRNVVKTNSSLALFNQVGDEGFASNFLVQPKYIKYQQTQKITPRESKFTTLPNEALQNVDGWSSNIKYVPSDTFNGVRYDAWGEDYIWVPSLSEVGGSNSANTTCIWKLSNEQRSHTYSKSCWFRSGMAAIYDGAYHVNNLGGQAQNSVEYTHGVRPAIHLNLSAATGGITRAVDFKDQTYVYDGYERLFTSMASYGEYKNAILSLPSKAENGNNIDVGTYTQTLTLKEGYYIAGQSKDVRTKTVTITITPKEIECPHDVSYEYDGKEHIIKEIAQEAEEHPEKNITPVTWYNSERMEIEYPELEEGKKPIEQGAYKAVVKLKKNSSGTYNYYFQGHSGETEVTIYLNIIGKVISPSKLSFVFDGKDHRDDVKNTEITPWYNEDLMNIIYKDEYDYTSAGKHIFVVEIKNPGGVSFQDSKVGETTKEFFIEISKKVIKLGSLVLDENEGTIASGHPITLSPDVNFQTCGDDFDTMQFGLEYRKKDGSVWSTKVPTVAGEYVVRPFIIGESNYELFVDGSGKVTGEVNWSRTKKSIKVPYVTTFQNQDAPISSVGYSGSEQSFVIPKSLLPNDVNISSCSNNLYYNNANQTFSAKNVGEYWIKVSLSDDGAGTKWEDNYADVERTINFVIEKAELGVSLNVDSVTTWSKGQVETVLLNLTGVKNSEDVSLNIYLKKTGASNTQAASFTIDKSSEDGNWFITLFVGTFTEGKYELFVELTNENINKNYSLKVSSKADAVAEFFVTKSQISFIDLQWLCDGVVVSSDYTVNDESHVGYSEGFEIEFTGKNITLTINETLLPTGVSVSSYSNNTAINAGEGTKPGEDYVFTTVTLVADSDYELTAPKKYTINWKINPKLIDLGQLEWNKEVVYDGSAHNVEIVGLDSDYSFITILSSPSPQVDANKYDMDFIIATNDGRGNYIFTNPNGYTWIEIVEGTENTKAKLTLSFEIKKQEIHISNASKDWVRKTRIDNNGKELVYYVPRIAEDAKYQSLINVVYFESSATDVYIDILNIDVPNSIKEFFVRVSLKNNSEELEENIDNYILINDTNGNDYATYSFYLGDNRPQITLTYNFVESEGTEYNGEGQEVVVTPQKAAYSKVKFKISYFKQCDGGEVYLENGELPTDVGIYRVHVEDFGGIYNILNSTFYLEIKPLIVEIDGWESTGSLTSPMPKKIANIPLKGEWFNLCTYDINGNIVYEPTLNYNSAYTATITSLNENVIFAEDAQTSYSFRTEINTDKIKNLKVPTLVNDVLEWDSVGSQFVFVNENDIFEYAEIVSGDLFQTEVGDNYKVVLRIKNGANAMFEGGLIDWTVKFKVVPKVLENPNLDKLKNVRYTGDEINALSIIFGENWQDYFMFLNLTINEGFNSYIQINAGSYSFKYRIDDEYIGKVVWKNQDEVMLATNDEVDEKTITWQILPQQIVASWDNSKGYPILNVSNRDHKQLFTLKFFKEGDETETEIKAKDLIEGEMYTYQLVLKDEYSNNYEFKIDGVVIADNILEDDFTYKKPFALGEFFKNNYLYIIIALAVLLFLIFLIVLLSKRKKKNEDKGEKQKFEREKAELELKLAEAKLQNNNMSMPQGNYQQNYNQISQPLMPTQAPMPQQYQSSQSNLDYKIDELRDAVSRLAKYQLASEEEKAQNKQLSKIEDMLKKYLTNNFANNPNWIPFNNQDMINYNINDLMRVYSQAKLLAENNLKNSSQAISQNQLQQEAKGFENSIDEYMSIKDKSSYEKILSQMRVMNEKLSKVEEDNKILQEKLENEKKYQIEKELEQTKQELAKKQNEIDNLKQETQLHQQEKLMEELVKKNNSQQIATKPQIEKPEFVQAFNNLQDNQKQYFNQLKDYALTKPQARIKQTKFNISVGVGNSAYIKFAIKYNTLIACFITTEIKLDNDAAVEKAKQMIDEASKQINSEN